MVQDTSSDGGISRDVSRRLLSEKQFYTFGSPDEPMVLESGQTLASVTVAYETFGSPNADKSNAILILHALTGDSHAAGYYAQMADDEKDETYKNNSKPGWWDMMIGPGKAFDTDQYWIICSNVMGGCQGTTGARSKDPGTGKPYGLSFPIVTVGDMVDAQKRLMAHLGIAKWHAVAGGSLGGFQALEWAVKYPDLQSAVVCIASGAKLSAQGIAFNAVGRHAIMNDERWQNGQYVFQDPPDVPRSGLATARMLAHITYLSEVALEQKFGRRLQGAEAYLYNVENEFAVESYLKHQGERFIERFDANCYLYLTKAMDYFDVAAKYGEGSLARAFARTSARFLLIGYTSDWLFPAEQSKDIAHALKQNHRDVTFVALESPHGHDAFLLESASMTRLIQPFLAQQNTPEHATGSVTSPRRSVPFVKPQ